MAPSRGRQTQGTNGGLCKATSIILQCLCVVALVALTFGYWRQMFPATCTPPVLFTVAAIPDVPQHIIEQYKIYVTDLGTYESQLAATQTVYLTLIGALISVLAFKEAIRPIKDYAHPASISVFIFIAAICAVWSATAFLNKDVFSAKFKVLKDMETIPGLYPMFTNQRGYYGCDAGSLSSTSYLHISLVTFIGAAALVFAAIGIRSMCRTPSS